VNPGVVRGVTVALRTVAVLAVVVPAAGCRRDDLGTPPAVCSTSAVNAGTSAEMEPGGDCIGCHSSGEGPSFLAAGTVMNDLHDDTNCGGVAGVTVRITGSDGKVTELTTNATGNFFLESRGGQIALPFNAEVTRAGITTKMLAAQMSGDCNSCHTAKGAMLAFGRIVAPTM